MGDIDGDGSDDVLVMPNRSAERHCQPLIANKARKGWIEIQSIQ